MVNNPRKERKYEQDDFRIAKDYSTFLEDFTPNDMKRLNEALNNGANPKKLGLGQEQLFKGRLHRTLKGLALEQMLYSIYLKKGKTIRKNHVGEDIEDLSESELRGKTAGIGECLDEIEEVFDEELEKIKQKWIEKVKGALEDWKERRDHLVHTPPVNEYQTSTETTQYTWATGFLSKIEEHIEEPEEN